MTPPSDRPAGHWALSWLGREYLPGVYECADFVIEVLEREFGRRIVLPAAPPRDAGPRAWRDAVAAGLAGEIAAPTDAPAEGDGVLMRLAGRRATGGDHIGVWCAPGGRAHVLHCIRDAGSCLHALDGLAAAGLALAGVYRWL